VTVCRKTPLVLSLAIFAAISGCRSPEETDEGALIARVSQAQANLRVLAIALETYRVDYPAYPPWVIGADSPSVARGNRLLRTMPPPPPLLTTPIAPPPNPPPHDSTVTQPSPALTAKTYDPTNGSVSDGDLHRVSPESPPAAP
jgi:hypothetical protein